jgi:hypothetical protein
VTRRFLLAGTSDVWLRRLKALASHRTAKPYAREFLQSWHESQRYMEERKKKPHRCKGELQVARFVLGEGADGSFEAS